MLCRHQSCFVVETSSELSASDDTTVLFLLSKYFQAGLNVTAIILIISGFFLSVFRNLIFEDNG
jgi:hypothetical protein